CLQCGRHASDSESSMTAAAPSTDAPTSSATYIVRHGAVRFLGDFPALNNQCYLRGTDVIVRSDRGQEVGQVLCQSSPQAVAMLSEPTKGQILRPMTVEDKQRVQSIQDRQ